MWYWYWFCIDVKKSGAHDLFKWLPQEEYTQKNNKRKYSKESVLRHETVCSQVNEFVSSDGDGVYTAGSFVNQLVTQLNTVTRRKKRKQFY